MKGDKVVEVAEICANLMMFLFIFRREHLYFCQVICVNCWVACSSTVIQNSFNELPVLNKAEQKNNHL